MYSAWFRSTFLRVLKFLQIKKLEPHFSEELILLKVWIICSTLLYFKFKSFMDLESWSLIRFQKIFHDSGIRFPESWIFCKLKRKDLISWKNQLCRTSELLDHPLLYFNFTSLKDRNFSSFSWFQYILHVPGLLFSVSWNFYKLRSGT